MVDCFHYFYASVRNRNKYLTRFRWYALERFMICALANVCLPVYFRLTRRNKAYGLPDPIKEKKRIIVSLTSFPARIGKVWLVIECLLRQSRKPDMIVLWLSEEQFPSLSALPGTLLKLRERGLRIELRKGDLRSHKKYCYSFTEYPEDIIITADDDIFYPSSMIESLILTQEKYPQAVICRYAWKMRKDNDGKLLPYVQWVKRNNDSAPSFDTFFGSGGGTVFSQPLYKDLCDKCLSGKLCPTADDVWLNAMCRLAGIPVKCVDESCAVLPVLNKRAMNLFLTNMEDGGNDRQIEAVRKYYIREINRDPFLFDE